MDAQSFLAATLVAHVGFAIFVTVHAVATDRDAGKWPFVTLAFGLAGKWPLPRRRSAIASPDGHRNRFSSVRSGQDRSSPAV